MNILRLLGPVALLAMAKGCGDLTRPDHEMAEVQGTNYRWPSEQTVISGGERHVYVRYDSSPDPADPDAFLLIYDPMYQQAVNRAGFPHLALITTPPARREEFTFHRSPAGVMICAKAMASLGFSCGLSFVHRGARWQLLVPAHRSNSGERLRAEAVATLERFADAARLPPPASRSDDPSGGAKRNR